MGKKSSTATPESRHLTAAIKAKGVKNVQVAEAAGVTPSLVSQWKSGLRPVPADTAPKLTSLLGVKPGEISASFRDVAASASDNLAREQAPALIEEPDFKELVKALEVEVQALSVALGTLAAVMVIHRPAEAMEAASALKKRAPAKLRDTGFLHELIALLEKSARA